MAKYRQCNVLFNAKDNALNKNFEDYGSQSILTEYSQKNWTFYWKIFGKQVSRLVLFDQT